MVVGGGRARVFGVTAGVRQGYPLPPLITAVAAVFLLLRLRRFLPVGLIRAYADDLVLVSDDG
eukprot:8290066-Lingulodinium_polyedra.AAC.1